MKVETCHYTIKDGWSCQSFPNLDSENTLVLIFAAPRFIDDPAPILEFTKHYPLAKIIGCSSAGEILDMTVSDDSIVTAVIQFEKTPIKLATVAVNSVEESFQAGTNIAKELNDADLRGIFVLSEGLKINGSELVKGLNSIENNHQIVITGGLAGDGSAFKKTWLISGQQIVTSKVVAIGFYGDHIKIGHGSRGGWDIFGPERRITRSKNNILYELDGKPALTLYKEYLGDKASGLPATGLLFPLAIRKDTDDTAQLVRTILAVDEKEQSLIFAGDVPMGYLAQLMRANFDRLISGANEAAKRTLEMGSNTTVSKESPLVLIAISCVGRKLLLGDRIVEEVETLLDIFPKGTTQIGFYSYGEISPHQIGNCDLHNQTMTLTSLQEDV
jgi:hypothetical protein